MVKIDFMSGTIEIWSTDCTPVRVTVSLNPDTCRLGVWG
ncbi:hypothetical protein TOL_3417 [Thalassolituus oleivorans MIL-1]|uniref:Uncharacterized protein n=1 Tax=Thalassolituus oleivorans MIL-1 TaxID=1298593 RepID=M5DV90_9GAMM|nr:hypothetical protein TOL_3417 [Thalassolituus oleivorans MIL-1]